MAEIQQTKILDDKRKSAFKSTTSSNGPEAYLLNDPHIQIYDALGNPVTELILPYERINAILYYHTTIQKVDSLYIAGAGIFAKINNLDDMVEILTYDKPKLPGANIGLFDILFDGCIYEMESSLEYPNLITFVSNISGAIGVFYEPNENEFYIAPTFIKKAYKLMLDNTEARETNLPGFAGEDKEDFERWIEDHKIFPDN